MIDTTLQTFDITVTGQGASGVNKISGLAPISAGSATSHLSSLSVKAGSAGAEVTKTNNPAITDMRKGASMRGANQIFREAKSLTL